MDPVPHGAAHRASGRPECLPPDERRHSRTPESRRPSRRPEERSWNSTSGCHRDRGLESKASPHGCSEIVGIVREATFVRVRGLSRSVRPVLGGQPSLLLRSRCRRLWHRSARWPADGSAEQQRVGRARHSWSSKSSRCVGLRCEGWSGLWEGPASVLRPSALESAAGRWRKREGYRTSSWYVSETRLRDEFGRYTGTVFKSMVSRSASTGDDDLQWCALSAERSYPL